MNVRPPDAREQAIASNPISDVRAATPRTASTFAARRERIGSALRPHRYRIRAMLWVLSLSLTPSLLIIVLIGGR